MWEAYTPVSIALKCKCHSEYLEASRNPYSSKVDSVPLNCLFHIEEMG